MKRNKTDLQWNSETELDRLANSQSLDDAEKFMRNMIVVANDLDTDGKVAALTEWENYYRKRRAEKVALKREQSDREKDQDTRKSSTYRKYAKDVESLALLEAAKKLKEKLAKRNPAITDKAVIQALFDEPDGNETKKQNRLRSKYRCRVWYGAVKNGKRKNATAIPSERLDPKTKSATWDKIYKKWGSYLSAYLNHPPAK